MNGKHIMIAGIRGIPARHGGFETFAERLSLYLVSKGWKVTVFCQSENSKNFGERDWSGICREEISVSGQGPFATILFDWKSTLRAARTADIVLVLGYNTATFSMIYWLRGVTNVMNMDGIEWKRRKWNWWQKSWLRLNERLAGIFATRLIADHPEIRRHLMRGMLGRKDTVVIPYGADDVSGFSDEALMGLALHAHEYALVIARPEPENQILEIVRAFSGVRRGKKLVVLGNMKPELNRYHRAVVEAAGDEVCFPGAIYDAETVASLRANASLYIHGHTVGGTNPSLVEALGAGAPILADNNIFNRWVAGEAARYFRDEYECGHRLDELLNNPGELDRMRAASVSRFKERFCWEDVLGQYENLLCELVGP